MLARACRCCRPRTPEMNVEYIQDLIKKPSADELNGGPPHQTQGRISTQSWRPPTRPKPDRRSVAALETTARTMQWRSLLRGTCSTRPQGCGPRLTRVGCRHPPGGQCPQRRTSRRSAMIDRSSRVSRKPLSAERMEVCSNRSRAFRKAAPALRGEIVCAPPTVPR